MIAAAHMVNNRLIADTDGGYAVAARGRRDGMTRMADKTNELRNGRGVTLQSAPLFGLRASQKDHYTDALTQYGVAIGAGA